MTSKRDDLHVVIDPPAPAPIRAHVCFQVITAFPQLLESLQVDGVVGRALKNHLVALELRNPREYTSDLHKTIDDRPFGGGDGMVMLAETLELSLQSFSERGEVIFFTPKGEKLTDALVQELAQKENITMICGRYSGVDQRVLNGQPHREISIGDFVISGGELAAMVLIDAVTRFVPGVLGHDESAKLDSITMGHLEAPLFTRPREWRGQAVPEILLSGHHEKIQDWNLAVGLAVTLLKRPDLFATAVAKIDTKGRRRLRPLIEAITAEEWKVLGLSALDRGHFLSQIQSS